MRTLADLAEWLRRERLQRGLSQSELATQAGVPHRTYQRLEAGDPGARLTTLLRTFGALGVELKTSPARRPTLEELADIYDDEEQS